jgi:hypothetical protein
MSHHLMEAFFILLKEDDNLFIPEISVDGDKFWYTTNHLIPYVKRHGMDLGIGRIIKFEQHGQTVYVKGSEHNAIVVNTGLDSIKVLYEYSHEIPTWMKEDFNRFLNE